jgi:hypothetical protein
MLRVGVLCGLMAAMAYGMWRLAPEPFVARPVALARAHWERGDVATARRLAAAALPGLRFELAARPEDVYRHMALAEALALAGEAAQALTEADRAIAADLAPWATSPRRTADGSLLETYAVVATEAGAPERALAALDRLLAHGARYTTDELRVDPRFKRLRPDARFAQLLAAHDRSGHGSRQGRRDLERQTQLLAR